MKTGKIATQSATNPLRGEILRPVSNQRLNADVISEASAASSARFPAGFHQVTQQQEGSPLWWPVLQWLGLEAAAGQAGDSLWICPGDRQEGVFQIKVCFYKLLLCCVSHLQVPADVFQGISGQGSDLVGAGGTQTSKGISSITPVSTRPSLPTCAKFDLHPHNPCSKQRGENIK